MGGTPCQDFSVAGLRAGLDGERGNLTLEYLRLADRARPRWLVWENVPGVLSIDGGRTFGAVLGGLAQLGYGFAYRVLDAQFFGVPQRRRRVFVVGYLGDWRRAAAVLFERHSLSGHPAPRREAREGATGGARPGFAFDGQNIGVSGLEAPVGTLDTGGGHLNRGLHIAHALRGEGFDASEDGTGRGTPLVPVPFDTTQITSAANYSRPKPGDPCHPLAAGMHPPAIAYQTSGNCGAWETGQVTGALDTGTDRSSTVLAFDMRGREGGSQFEGPHDTANIRAGSGGSSRSYLAASAVRRLTPRECERLQGFPDGYTLVPYRKGMMADGPRYKALGNSMAVPVMRWIGERIEAVDGLRVNSLAA